MRRFDYQIFDTGHSRILVHKPSASTVVMMPLAKYLVSLGSRDDALKYLDLECRRSHVAPVQGIDKVDRKKESIA